MKTKCKHGPRSKLSWATLSRYARSDLVERHPEDNRPIYKHASACPNYCDYACNGQHGLNIAEDIELLEAMHPTTA